MAFSAATVGTAGRGTTSSQAVSLSNVPAGALVIVDAVIWSSSTGGTVTFPTTLTDNQGNTFTRRSAYTSVDSFINGAIFEGIVPSLTVSWSITVTQTNASGTIQWDVVPFYHTGNASSSEFSQVATNSSGGATSLAIGPTAANGATTELGVAGFSSDAAGTAVYSSATLTTGWSWIYRQNDDSSLQCHAVAEGIEGTSGLSFHSATASVTASSIASGAQTGLISTYNAAAVASFDPSVVPWQVALPIAQPYSVVGF